MPEISLSQIKPELVKNDSETVLRIKLLQNDPALKGWECRATVEPKGWSSEVVALRDNVKIEIPVISSSSVVKIFFYNYYGVRQDSCFTAKISSNTGAIPFVQTEIKNKQKKIRKNNLFFIFLLIAACFGGIFFYKNYPQYINKADNTLYAPVFHVGDSYTYKTTDHITPKYSNTVIKEVVEIAGDQLTMRKTYLESKITRLILYDFNLGLKAGSEENTFEPAYKYFEFPGKIGQPWKSVSTERTKNGESKVHSISGSIISLEIITVPAGTFDTWKIVVNSVMNHNGKDENYGTDISWYAPSIKNSVKSELETKNADGKIIGRKTVELIEYSLKE